MSVKSKRANRSQKTTDSEQHGPNVELVLLNLRKGLERFVLEETRGESLRGILGVFTTAEEARVGVDFERSSGARSDPIHSATEAQPPTPEVESRLRLDPTASHAIVEVASYWQWRWSKFDGSQSTDEFRAEEGHRGDHLAQAIGLVAAFIQADAQFEQLRAILQHVDEAMRPLASITKTLGSGIGPMAVVFHQNAVEIEDAVGAIYRTLDTVRARLDHLFGRDFWTNLLGQRAIEPRTSKPIWLLDAVDRRRQVILATREVLFRAFGPAEVEALVPDGEGGGKRKQVERVRSQRDRHLASLQKART